MKSFFKHKISFSMLFAMILIFDYVSATNIPDPPALCQSITRQVSNAKSNNSDPWDDIGVVMNLLNTGNASWLFEPGATFQENADGTGVLTGVIYQFGYTNRRLQVNINFSGRNWIGPFFNQTGVSTASWYVYPTWSGTMTGLGDLAGGSITLLKHLNSGIQAGIGANQVWNSTDLTANGAGTWFEWSVTSQPTNPANAFQGFTNVYNTDLNILLSGIPTVPCDPPGGNTPPTISISDITVTEGVNPTATLQICASQTSAVPMSVFYSTSNVSAIASTDYTATLGTAVIPAGQTCTTVTFPILNDNITEPTELFNVNLSTPTNATIGDPLGTVTILDNDSPQQPAITINDVTVTEGVNPTASLQICISAASGSAITVNYSTSNGSATAGSDYTTTSGTATIPAGQTCTTVTFPILNDNITEPTELFNVNLTTPTNATIGDPLGTVTVLDNDSSGPDCNAITFNTAPGQITVGGLNAPIVMVQIFNSAWQTILNCAGNCNTPTQTVSNLPAGTYYVKVTFLTSGWSQICLKEIYIDVPPPSTVPTISINDVTVTEGVNPTASLQICASQTSASPMTVSYSTSNGSATNGTDYTTTSGTATILAGQTCTTVTFPIVNDNIFEPTELFNVNLSTPTNATIGDPLGTVTILDNDTQVTPSITINDVTVTEGVNPTASLQICIPSASGSSVTVSYQTSNGSAVSGADYTTTTGTATIPAGQTCTTVTIPIVDDNILESPESFNVTLTNPTNATIGDPLGTVTILDNDSPIPSITINDVTVTEGVNPTASVQICIPSASGSPVTVSYQTSNGSAVSGADYTTTTGTATIPAGQTCTTVTIPIVDDNILESPELFNITLTNPTNATIGDPLGTVTILDNDSPIPSITINDVTVTEGVNPTASVQICIPSASGSPVTVSYQTSNGSAVSGADYTTTTGTATIPAGQTCTTVTIPIVDDNILESPESFNITLTNPTNATIGDPLGTVTILDNDSPIPSITINDVTVTEGVNPTASVQICIPSASGSPVTVSYQTSNGSAVSGADYTTTSGTATIPAGQTCTTVTIPIVDDNILESPELFNVTLTNPTNATIGDPLGTVTILDNDAPVPSVTINDVTVTEGVNPTASVQICIPSASGSPVTVSYQTSNGSAVSGADYTTTSGTATIPAGQTCTTVTIPIVDDNILESPELFNVTLTNPTNATIGDPLGTVTILDNDAPVPSVTINDVTVTEGVNPTASLQICIPSASGSNVTVSYQTSNGSAVSGADYTTTSGTATILAGQTCTTVTFPIVDDNMLESTELFNVILTNPTNATIGDPLGTVTILDNDAPVPAVTISDVTVTEGVNPTASLQICIPSASGSNVTVSYQTSNGSAVSGADYTTTSGTATILAGQTCTTVTFPIVDDNMLESTELFNVILTNPTNATIGDPLGTVTILDNDAPVPAVTINDVTVTEGVNPTASLQICIPAASSLPVTVTYNTSNVSALSGSDYTSTTGTATIAAGQTCTVVTFPILNDNILEPTELFNVTLTNPTNATIGDPLGTVTILDNDAPPPAVTINDVTVTEGVNPTASLQICIPAASALPVTVTYNSSNVSALAGSDYTTTTGTATIAAGQTCTTVTFPILDDSVLEPTELFNVTLTNPINATISDATGTVTILDNGDPICAPVSLATWSLNQCVAFSGAGSYSEFVATTNSSSCATVSATVMSRTSPSTNTHSCAYGVTNTNNNPNGDLAMCISGYSSSTYSSTSSKNLLGSITITPNAGSTLKVSTLQFYVKSPSVLVNVGTSTTTPNNRLTKVGVTITNSSGAVLYANAYAGDITSNWTLVTVDLSLGCNANFEVTSGKTYNIKLLGYAPASTNQPMTAWEIDDIRFIGCCTNGTPPCDNVTSGGTISKSCINGEVTLSNATLPSGGSGAIEYLWVVGTSGCNLAAMTPICNSNSMNFVVGNVSQTTYFLRCSRRVGCPYFVGESNCITVSPNECGSATCNNVVSGGTVSKTCVNGQPVINSVTLPTGGSGTIEYLWLYGSSCNVTTMTPIPSSNSLGLNVGNVPTTTYFIRCARRAGCQYYIGESNCVVIYPNECPTLLVGDQQFAQTFSSSREGYTARIEWSVNSLNDIDYFVLERLNEKIGDFESMEYVDVDNLGKLIYQVYDNDPFGGDNFYRLRTVNYDGTDTYSDVEKVNFENLDVFPNPADETLTVDLKPYEGQKVTLYFYNQLGVEVEKVNADATFDQFITLDISNYTNGNYFVRAVSDNRRDVTKQVMIQH